MKKIAIIGSGISGLGAAWALRNSAHVTVFEQPGRARACEIATGTLCSLQYQHALPQLTSSVRSSSSGSAMSRLFVSFGNRLRSAS